MFLATALATPTEAECKEEIRLGVDACQSVLFGRLPTASCCQRVRDSHVECICPAITPRLAALIDVNRVIKLIEGCGRIVPRNFKCGINRCNLCMNDSEDHGHLFFKCLFSKNIWEKIQNMTGLVGMAPDWERNNEIFRDETKDWETVCNMVVEIVKLKLMGLRVKKSRAVNGRASDIVDEATYRWLRESCCEDVNCNMVLSRNLLFNTCKPFLPVRLSNTVTCAMKSYKLSDLTPTEVDNLKARPRIDFSSIFSTVQPIVDDVRTRGDAAVKDYTLRFDKVELEKIIENVSDLPDPELDEAVRESFDVAYSNIYAFHAAQKPVEKVVENMEGVRCKRVARSISSVGLYVPGGTAVLPSTALMLAIPAQIAGCKTVVLATPPSSDGSICKEVLYCAKKAGVTHILKAGGAQAISAMAWGTASCPKAEKIFGPGNQYVTAAKMILQNSEAMVSIDMPAGPSEVLVIADKYASPVHIAADLLSQAEHGPDSQVVLVIAGDGVDINVIEEEITKQCNSLPRGEFALKALSHSFTVFAHDMVEAVAFSNLYAPEHLIINVKDAEKWESFIENAGSVFLGQWTPESVGDYASGTNHVLPTYGYARMYSGVSLDSFLKYITIQSLTEEGLVKLGPHVATMAEVEGLDAHKRAVTLRLQDIKARQAA
ncbi:histidinol dehydrogenase, chloroplastic isoform X1 [Tanacetum coccineum]